MFCVTYDNKYVPFVVVKHRPFLVRKLPSNMTRHRIINMYNTTGVTVGIETVNLSPDFKHE